VQAFYAELARGARVGQAMLAGQLALLGDSYRGVMMGAGELHLQDWFVPVLYQEEQDPQLITRLPPGAVRQLEAQERRLRLGALPEAPAHAFIGRSRELLAVERLLHEQPWAAVTGQGGRARPPWRSSWPASWPGPGASSGPPLSAWNTSTTPGGADSLGRRSCQKVTSTRWRTTDLKRASPPVERALRDQATLIVLDNLRACCRTPAAAAAGAAPVEECSNCARRCWRPALRRACCSPAGSACRRPSPTPGGTFD
jgi:hypothetical protein